MEAKKKYTRADKIQYYNWLIFDLSRKLTKAKERLDHIMSDNYQEWNGDLQEQLNKKKKA